MPGLTRTVKFFLGRIFDIGLVSCRDVPNTLSVDFSIWKLENFKSVKLQNFQTFANLGDFSDLGNVYFCLTFYTVSRRYDSFDSLRQNKALICLFTTFQVQVRVASISPV